MQVITDFDHIDRIHQGDECDNRFFVIGGQLYEVCDWGLVDGFHCVIETYRATDASNLGEVVRERSEYKYRDNFIRAYDFGEDRAARDEFVIELFAKEIREFRGLI